MYDKNMFWLNFVTTALCLSYTKGVKSWTCTDCLKARKWTHKKKNQCRDKTPKGEKLPKLKNK